jgi:hypothetical protein
MRVTTSMTRALGFICVSTLAACAGANVDIVADHARYPVSMSGAVRDGDGTLLDIRSLKTVGRFGVDASRVGIFYSAVTPRSPLDISDEVNTQVAQVGGEAIVRLSVTVDDSCNPLNVVFLLNALPIWPGCVPVEIHGLIVRRKSSP